MIKNYSSWVKALLVSTTLFFGACQKELYVPQSSESVLEKDATEIAQWYNNQLIKTGSDTGFASRNIPNWNEMTIKQVGDTRIFTTPLYTKGNTSREAVISIVEDTYTGIIKEYNKVDKYFTTVRVYSINGKPIEEGFINITGNYHVTKTWEKSAARNNLTVMSLGDENGGGDPSDPGSGNSNLANKLNAILKSGDSYTFDNSINSYNGYTPNSVDDFQTNYLDAASQMSVTYSTNTNGADTLVRAHITLGYTHTMGIDIDLKLSKNSGNYSVSEVTTDEWGITAFFSYNKSNYTVDGTASSTELTIRVYGKLNYNVFIEGHGTVYKQKLNFIMKVNKYTGTMTSLEQF
ncbi:hypothetical protein ASU31_00195 [Pedobacter ginsenosidimutans]|uniref:Uncharacterized protein n=1 Tax=Pedobacter ginsenosidimutans TaxID=687842 RepID=A0A0T5VVT4_9SPHI|nr:hypothetical protein [Pedobacter ginsenosidimutans]KRT17753.1 hypothetical protein ASU31_00195 [Pedobacter ginsenosidimutans]